jgi:hypothetical protein
MVVVAGERKPAIRKQRNVNKNEAGARVSTVSSQQNEKNKKRYIKNICNLSIKDKGNFHGPYLIMS